ncbi:MAG TPA: aldo/keto reductase [Solirubrobacteraceae bacterium]
MASPETLSVRRVPVPRLGFGTWQITGRDCERAVADALEIGYRHIDTARAYGNEREVGRGLAASGLARDEIFLATKLWMDEFEPDRLRAAAEDSLARLGTDYVDLLLLHWPNPDVPLEATLGAMVELREAGHIRELGVSNFPPGHLRRALAAAPVFTDQVELHPFLGAPALFEISEEQDVMITAYAPLAHGKVVDDPTLREIGEAHGKSAGQVALRWLLDQPRVAVIPKASSPERRRENFDVFDFALSAEQRAAIDALPKDRRDFSPEWAPDWAD